MAHTGLAELGPIQVAVTVDDLILWKGAPLAPSRTSLSTVRSLARTLTAAGLTGTWGFAHSSAVERDPGQRAVFEEWVTQGHHLGNHTHSHAPLNWVEGDVYCRDIDKAERAIGDLIALAPERYFRYAMDMAGPSEERRGRVQDHITDLGYVNAPCTAWFGDFTWTVPYYRAHATGNTEAAAMLRETYVTAAVTSLVRHARAARQMFGRDIPYIWHLHATAIAQDCLGLILDEFASSGVEFVGLAEAMTDVHNRVQPPVDGRRSNHLDRFARAYGTSIPGAPPELVQTILEAAPMAGPYSDSIAVYDEVLHNLYLDGGGVSYDWDWSAMGAAPQQARERRHSVLSSPSRPDA